MADLEMISKGIVNAINQYSESMNTRMALENELVMDEIEQQRKIKYEKDKPFYDPLYVKQAKDYITQHPDDADLFADTPMGGWVEGFKKERDIAKQKLPILSEAIKPTETVGIENGKFKSYSPKDIVTNQIWGKVQRGEQLSEQEMKLAGIDTELMYKDDLRKFQGGEVNLKDMYRKYPNKSKEVYEIKKRNLSPETSAIMSQLEDLIKKPYMQEGSNEEQINTVKDAITDVVNNETILRSRGVDVDAIFELLNIDPKTFKRASKKEGLWSRIMKKWFKKDNPLKEREEENGADDEE